ncbi:MAG: type 4a pilus biogenesis protein PilO [Fibromonadaceae bacterium]|jgi:type IV pilus assembly protein PilO|nr:type 4a pilus biogenesis protein PilO [Fibromonadaceae bacterium]
MAVSNFDIRDKKNIYLVVAILACLGSGYSFYDFIWTKFQKEKQHLVEEQKNAQDELDRINAQRPRIPMLEADLRNAEIEFDRLKEMFPEEEKVPIRLQDLYAVVRASGVNIQAFRPAGSQVQEHFVENNYSFNVNAGYHMLGELFAEIANFNYPTTINNLKLVRSGVIAQEVKKAEDHGWDPITMGVSFDLTTFTSRKQ